MTLALSCPKRSDFRPRVAVWGVGGAGGNAVNNMIRKNLEGVEFVVANTDAQALLHSDASHCIQLGEKKTGGLGAGAVPEVGAQAAEESRDKIVDALEGCHLVFISAGMGGGTGTGAAPVIAQIAHELGVLTVGFVTKPFTFEGTKRMKEAEKGIKALAQAVDTMLVIPNQNLFFLTQEKTSASDAYAMVDDVLYHGVKGMTDLMMRPGRINLDFADIRTIIHEGGRAIMGTGKASGEGRAEKAANIAISNQLLDEINLKGATGILVNIIGKTDDITLHEIEEAARYINKEIFGDANVVYGTSFDDTVEGLNVCVFATGIGSQKIEQKEDDNFFSDDDSEEFSTLRGGIDENEALTSVAASHSAHGHEESKEQSVAYGFAQKNHEPSVDENDQNDDSDGILRDKDDEKADAFFARSEKNPIQPANDVAFSNVLEPVYKPASPDRAQVNKGYGWQKRPEKLEHLHRASTQLPSGSIPNATQSQDGIIRRGVKALFGKKSTQEMNIPQSENDAQGMDQNHHNHINTPFRDNREHSVDNRDLSAFLRKQVN